MPIDLMPQIQEISGVPGFSVSTSIVTISVNRDDKESYLMKGVKTATGEELFGLAKRGIYKFIRDGGIETLESKGVWRVRPDIPIWNAEWLGRYLEPIGKWTKLPGDKEIDLRIGGTRWEEKFSQELMWLLINEGKKVVKLPWPKGARNIDFATLVKRQITGERLEELTDIAEARATQFVRKQAQFGAEIASTGAMLRGIMRIMNLKHAYTAKELTEGFYVKCTHLDYEQMAAFLGKEKADAYIESRLANVLGVDPGQAQRLVTNGQEPPIEAEIVEAEIVEEETQIEVEEDLPETVPEEANEEKPPEEFSMPIKQETMEWIIENHESAQFAGTQGMLMYLLDKPKLEDLTEGEGLNIKHLISEVAKVVETGSTTDLRKAKTETREKLRELNEKRQLWEENDESAEELSE